MLRVLALAALLLADVTPRGDFFRPETARLVASIQVSRTPISSFAFTRDGRRLVVLGVDGKLSTWDIAARRELRQAPGSFFGTRLQLSLDGTRALAPGPDRRSVRVIDIEKGEELRSFTDVQASQNQSYALSPDGRRVALIRRDQSVRITDILANADLRTLVEAGSGQAGAMAWSPDGKLLAIHGWDSTVRIFDPSNGELKASFGEVGRLPLFLAYSPDSSTLVVITQEARVKLYDKAGRELRTLDESLTGPRLIAFSRDGSLMAAADFGGKVRIWNARTWQRIRDLDAGAVRHLAFSPDGRVLALGSTDGVVRLWGGSGPWTGAPKIEAPRPGAPGYLGITGETFEGEGGGATILSVLGDSPAEKAGLKPGDRIVKVGTSVTDSFDSLRAAVMSLREGDEVEITYRREGADAKVKLKLAGRPAEE